MLCRAPVTVRQYERGECRTCGHGMWLPQPVEPLGLLQPAGPSDCGRCRVGLPPAPRREVPKACPICFEVSRAVQYATVANESWQNGADRCGAHGICAPCLQRYVEVKVLDEGLWNLRCPGERCRYRLVEDDIRRALRESGRREEALERHASLRKQSFAPRLEEVLAAQATKDTHESKAVDETEQLLLAECQVCPRCSVLVRREGGCRHIVCRCSQDFCFGCGAPFDREDDIGCVCEVDESVDHMDGEGRPSLGQWLQRNRAKEALQLAQDPAPAPSEEQDASAPSVEDRAMPAPPPQPLGSPQAASLVLAVSPEAPPFKAPLLLRASSLPQGQPKGLSRASRSLPPRQAKATQKYD